MAAAERVFDIMDLDEKITDVPGAKPLPPIKGKVGYVQPIGERAIPGQTVDANSQANFGVGAMLLVACEYDKYLTTK